ncbi:unnamed protein product [Adineta steineri]|uniref:G-protein coupled receptors family 1 profile domain-containing protein n=1 Tax=Adineta steineri TaxID=433720 RepID=A0A815U8J9_9BILA|nr:unnamed protein product [Adineta steineri]
MSSNESISVDSTTSALSLNRVKFGVFLTLQIPSAICSIYVFSQYMKRPNFRQSIHNHVVIVLLCSSFIFVTVPVSASEAFFFTAHVRPESNLFCAIWTWIHYSINISNLILMGFACAERHWLVFRLNAMRTRRSRILYHYIPIVLCMIYPWIFYFIFIFLYPCEPAYDYNQLLCLIPCYFFTNSIANTDTFMNNWIPIFAIPILSGALFIRFILQKQRMQIEVFRWKRDRKMVIQLLSITSLYISGWAPLQAATIYDNIVLGGVAPPFVVAYFYTFPYFVHLFYPFVVVLSNPELRGRIRDIRPQAT